MIDLINDFESDMHKLGGLALVIRELSNSDAGIRVACAWIVGKASQNNPVVQKQKQPKWPEIVYSEGGDLMLKGILSNATADVRLVSLVADLAEYKLEYTSKWDVPFFCNCALVRLLIDLIASGSFSLLKSSVQILNWVFVNFLRPAKNLKKDGSWALVMGPTDGIGKAFAFQLASKGLNLVLVGRNLAKLNDVSDSMRTKFKQTQIKVVVVDFSCDLDHGLGRIKETIAGIDVGFLINNVAVCYPYARFFHEVDDKLMSDLIKVNVEGTTKVTNVVLTRMIKRKKGAIVK
ncbi:unnamed protein product [Lactuca saligna]|uniref:Very-long-chain 3-oxoacyl-CoA reductase n=1 Tax=Lactuca saligna TaxID=75948 RepID=A0AA35YT64_LACSI|nr:unnamed protein product [Lactuca saligna]